MASAAAVTIFQPRPPSGVDFQRPRYERPSSAKLSGVKFELYNPRLPTLRRMDMDNICHKLSTEHSRTTTPCSRDDFITAKTNPWVQKTSKLHCKQHNQWHTAEDDLTPAGFVWDRLMIFLRALVHTLYGILQRPTMAAIEAYKPHGTSYIDNWNLILSNLKSQATQKKATQTNLGSGGVSGLAVRNKHPSITSAWQYTRAASAQGSRSRPMPATMYSRYRSTRPFSPNPWK